jgi:hypothetical protein
MNTSEKNIQKLAVFIPLAYYAIVIANLYSLPGISADGHTYLQIARNIRFGIGLGWQALWAAPLHSILIAGASLLPGVPDLQVAAGVVAIVMGAMLTVSLYLLATLLFDWKTGIAAAMVAVSFPHILDSVSSVEPEITYTAFLIASLVLLLAAGIKKSFCLATLCGITFSLAYMSRSEGFLIMVFTLSALCATQGFTFYRTALFRICLTVVLFFFLTASPYLIFLKKHYGSLVISPKATYVLIWMQSQVYHDNDKGEISNDELWGLTPDGRLKWQQPSGIKDLASFLMSHPAKSLSVYLHNLSEELPGRIHNSGGRLYYPQVFPVYAAVLALVALFMRWGEDSGLKKTVLSAPFLILLILPIFTGGWCKYLLPYAPLVIISACGGLTLVAEKCRARITRQFLRKTVSLAPFGISAIMAGYFISVCTAGPPAPRNADSIFRSGDVANTRNAALMARQKFGPRRNYMLQWNKMIYYLDGLWTPMPITGYRRMLEFARHNKVDYIVLEYSGGAFADSMRRGAIPPPGLSLAGIYRSEDFEYCAAFYEFSAGIK